MAEKKEIWISTADAAEMLGCTKENVQTLCRKGYLRISEGDARFYRILREDVEKRLNEIKSVTDIMVSTEELQRELKEIRDYTEYQKNSCDDRLTEQLLRGEVLKNFSILLRIFKTDLERYKDYISPADYSVLMLAFDGCYLPDMADNLKCTRENVRIRFERAMRHITKLDTFVDMYKSKIVALEDENALLRKKIANLKEYGTEEAQDEVVMKVQKVLNTRVDDLAFSVRTQSVLRDFEIETLGDLIVHKRFELLKARNFGRKSMNEIDDVLNRYHLKFESSEIETINTYRKL